MKVVNKRKKSVVYKKFLCALFIGVLGFVTPISAMEDGSEPLTRAGTSPTMPHTPPTLGKRCLDTLPDWYHPCFGPVVTNIKYFDLDPYWVNSRNDVFKEIYEELESCCSPSSICHPGRIPRELRKLCIVSRTHDEGEQRYNPFSNWCDNLGCAACLTMVPTGYAIMGVNLFASGLLMIIGGCWCCIGTGSIAMKCCLAKIHYNPPTGGCLDYIRSTPN